MASGGLPQWRAERLLGLLTAGGRLRPERQPRELFADHPQLVLRAGFASERCPRASASSPVRASSCFFNSISELGPLLGRVLINPRPISHRYLMTKTSYIRCAPSPLLSSSILPMAWTPLSQSYRSDFVSNKCFPAASSSRMPSWPPRASPRKRPGRGMRISGVLLARRAVTLTGAATATN